MFKTVLLNSVPRVPLHTYQWRIFYGTSGLWKNIVSWSSVYLCSCDGCWHVEFWPGTLPLLIGRVSDMRV